MKRTVAVLLALLMVLGCISGCSKPENHDPDSSTASTAPSNTTPSSGNESEGTENDQTKPEASEPDTTQPSVTEPDATEPQPSDPKPTDPEPTDPKPTDPEPTQPEPSVPERNPGDVYSRSELEAMSTKVNGWGLGPHTDDKNRPIDATKAQDKYGKYDAYYIGPDNGKIYLTFDEGYENGYTSRILDVLKEKNVKAVFFITMPYAKSEPELVQRMIDEGHVVGNHSVKHKSMPTLSIDKMISEVMDLHEYVKEHFGYEMTLFRPPMGEFSQQSLAVLQNLGYKTVEWSFAYYDYDPADQPDPAKALKKVTEAAHSGGIFLLHAVSKTNTDILGDVIDEFRHQGLEVALFT